MPCESLYISHVYKAGMERYKRPDASVDNGLGNRNLDRCSCLL